MAKKKVIVIDKDDEPVSADIGDILTDVAEEKELEEIQARIGEFQSTFSGKGFKVYVDKWNEVERKWKMADRFPLDGFDHFIVRDRFGPGRYRGRLMDANYKYIKQGGSLEFDFEAVLNPPAEKEPEKPSAIMDPGVQMMIESMKSQNMMMMEIIKVALPAQIQSQPAGATGKADLLMTIEALAKLSALGPKDTGLKSIEDSLRLTKLIRESFSDGDDKGGIVSELKEALALVPMLKERMGLPAPSAPIPATGGTQIVPVAPTRKFYARNPEMPENPVLEKIAPYIPQFEQAARTDQSLEKWADYLLEVLDRDLMPALVPYVRKVKSVPAFYSDDKLQDMIYDGLIEAAGNAEEVNKIFEFAPTLRPYENWVRGVITEAVRIVNEPEQIEEPEIRPSGNGVEENQPS